MSGPIVKVFGLLVVLFALLFVWTSRWTVIDASSLNSNALNVRPLLAELHTRGGRILANDGTVLAKPVPGPGGTWDRSYPTGSLFAFVVIRALSRAYQSEDMFARFAASGLAILFGVQAAINMAVNLQLIPAKGMTLPFISYGGSSIVANLVLLALLLLISDRARTPAR